MATINRVIYELVGVDRASPAFRRAGDSALAAETRLGRLGRTMRSVGSGMAALAAVAGYGAVKMATQFQASMTRIHTHAGASVAELQHMNKAVLQLAQNSQQGPQQLAEALFHIESVGLRGSKALQALKTASDLAAVGGADLEQSTNAIAGAWRSGIKGARDFGQAAAQLNAIIGAGNMRMQDLVDAMSTGILPAARTFGISLSEVGGALALLTDEGIPAQLAATRLRMALSLLGAPSQQAEKSLSQIGLTGLMLAREMRTPNGLINTIALLKDHLDKSGLSAAAQAQLISRAFGGGRYAAAIMTLINNLEVLRRKQQQINHTTGEYAKAIAFQRKTAEAQFALLRSKVQVLMIKLGTVLLPFAVSLANTFDNQLLPAAVRVAHAFGRIIPVEQIKRDWNAVLQFFGLGPKKAPDYQKIAPPNMAARIFATAAPAKAAAAGLSRIDFAGVTKHVTENIISMLARINWTAAGTKLAKVLVPLAVGFVNGLWDAILDEAIHHPLDLATAVASLIPLGRAAGIVSKLLGKIPLLGPLIRTLATPLEKAGARLESLLGGLLRRLFGPLARRIAPYFHGAVAWLRSKGETIILGLWLGAEHSWAKAMGWLGRLRASAVSRFRGAGSWLLAQGRAILGGLMNGLISRWPAVAGWLRGMGGRLTALVRGAATWLVSAGRAVLTGFLSGLTSAWRKVTSFISGIAGWISSHKGPPARDRLLLIPHGEAIMSGLLKGLQAKFLDVKAFIASAARLLRAAFSAHLIGTGTDSALVKLIARDNRSLAALASQRSQIAKQIAAATQYAQQTTSSLRDYAGLASLPTTDVLGGLQTALSNIRQFARDIATLRKMGLSRSLLRQIIDAGPEQGDQLAQAIIAAGDVSKLNSTEAAILKTTRALGRTAANDLYDNGKMAGQGFLAGLQSQQGALERMMKRLARTLVRTLRRELGIASPSRVTFALGAAAGRGFQLGIDSQRPAVRASARKLSQAGVPGGPARGARHGSAPLIHIENFIPTERADVDLLARKIVFGVGL